jgi:hypothetical protein
MGNLLFETLKRVIDDSHFEINSVGGAVQYGKIFNNEFKIYGINELKEEVHNWRGAIDLSDSVFEEDVSDLKLSYTNISFMST